MFQRVGHYDKVTVVFGALPEAANAPGYQCSAGCRLALQLPQAGGKLTVLCEVQRLLLLNPILTAQMSPPSTAGGRMAVSFEGSCCCCCRAHTDSSEDLTMHALSAAGGKMTVPCEGQLLLLLRPMDGGPVPEPIVLGQVPPLDVLMEAEGVQVFCISVFPGNTEHLVSVA